MALLGAVPPATACLEDAAEAATAAFEALIDALRHAPPDMHDEPQSVDKLSLAPHAASDDAGVSRQDGTLRGVPTSVLLRTHMGRSWGEWAAQCGSLAGGMRREASLRRSICDALMHAPPVEATADATEALTEESCDAMAQLWRLQPYLDDALLKAIATAAM